MHGRSYGLRGTGRPGDPGGGPNNPPIPPFDPGGGTPVDAGGSGGAIGPPAGPPSDPWGPPTDPVLYCSLNHFVNIEGLVPDPGGTGAGVAPEVAATFNARHFVTFDTSAGPGSTDWLSREYVGGTGNRYRVHLYKDTTFWNAAAEFFGITGWTTVAIYRSTNTGRCPDVAIAVATAAPFDNGFGDTRPSSANWG